MGLGKPLKYTIEEFYIRTSFWKAYWNVPDSTSLNILSHNNNSYLMQTLYRGLYMAIHLALYTTQGWGLIGLSVSNRKKQLTRGEINGKAL